MKSHFARFARAWASFFAAERIPELKSDANLMRLIGRIDLAAQLKVIPMPVIDDVNAAFAAYDTKVAAAEAALAPLQAQVTDLTNQLAAIDTAALTKTAALTAPAVTTPAADPAAPAS